jgi:predicted  nucleic acid-binding Zn-ribbon protein
MVFFRSRIKKLESELRDIEARIDGIYGLIEEKFKELVRHNQDYTRERIEDIRKGYAEFEQRGEQYQRQSEELESRVNKRIGDMGWGYAQLLSRIHQLEAKVKEIEAKIKEKS